MPPSRRSRPRRPTAPAEGERRALGGYYPQYRLNATLILRELREGRLVRLRIADPVAGRVDDLQLETADSISGYQIKWTQRALTFNSLITPEGDAPPLIRQLADGWTGLRSRHPQLRTLVHLTTNALPSSHDRLPVGTPEPERRHLAAFLYEVLTPLKASGAITLPAPDSTWGPTFVALRTATGLGEADFCSFLGDLSIDVGVSLPERTATPTRDEELYLQDLEALTQELFRIVTDRSRVVTLSRAELVGRLSWGARLEFANKHELHVDMQHYEPITATIEELERAVRTTQRGYLLLVGSPGSGKSSLLTQTLRQENVRLVRYYAYLPGNFNAGRGESTNFLHDVVLAIEEDPRFRTGSGLASFDRDQLLGRLRTQLGLLHEDFRTTGRKTVVVVDGLDHIPREQRPQRSLLDDLLPPSDIPEGVLFVLGSQTDAVLPPAIQVEVRREDHRVEMKALTREAVVALLGRNPRTAALTPEQKDRVVLLSGGHPLALQYLLNQLEDGGVVDTVLASAQQYGTSIEDSYGSYWPHILTQPPLVALLGRLARLRRPFELGWVERWAGEEVVTQLVQLAHYFRRDGSKRWSFFHNSFRQFLLLKTIERAPGDVDEAKGRRIHGELASLCAGEAERSTWHWEELYHRFEAQEWAWFESRPTLDEVRKQLWNFRPMDAIERDLRLALKAVAVQQAPIALARITLALKELGQRGFHLENATVIRPLLKLGEGALALEHIRDGDRLRVSPEGALQLASMLFRAGARGQARELFDLAQPLEMLDGEHPVDTDHQERVPGVLKSWVRAALAVEQRTVGQVLETISRVSVHAPHPIGNRDDVQLTAIGRASLRLAAGRQLVRSRRWDELELVLTAISAHEPDVSFWLLEDAWLEADEAQDRDRALEYLRRAAALPRATSGESEKLSIAEGQLRIARDVGAARVAYASIVPPPPYTDTVRDDRFAPFEERFRYARLCYRLGETRTPAELVPDPANPDDRGAVFVQRALYELARIASEADAEQFSAWSALSRRLDPILRLFYQSGRAWADWRGWHAAESARGEFYTLLVEVVALHGAECVDGLRQACESEWRDNAQWWPTASTS